MCSKKFGQLVSFFQFLQNNRMIDPPNLSQDTRPRFRSLDVFRGATVALMILVNNPGSWSAMYEPLAHAKWHGCTPTDLVFPFFLFAVGNSLAFVMQRLASQPANVFWGRVSKRTALIFAIGLVLNMSPFFQWNKENQLAFIGLANVRILGVLQRIALCFGASACIVWFFGKGSQVKGVLWTAAGLLVGYWIACRTLGASQDPYSLSGYFGTAIDRAVLGESHLYRGEGVPFDPEGIVSTLSAIAQVLFGWWVGRQIAIGKQDYELLAKLFLWAMVFLVITYFWQLEFPINKKIWTSTFVLLTTGLAMMGLSGFIYLIDIRQARGWTMAWVPFFEVFGKNPLFIFVLSGLVPRFFGLVRWQSGSQPNGSPIWNSPLNLLKSALANAGSDPRFGSLLYSIVLLTVYWLIARWLDRNRIYIRV
jgi:predicted acyltransferase